MHDARRVINMVTREDEKGKFHHEIRVPHGHDDMDGYPVSKDNYFVTLVASLNGLEFNPDQHMPLPVEDVSSGPLKQHQIELSRNVVFQALSFPSLDAYIERSLGLAQQQSEAYDPTRLSIYKACSSMELQRKAFGRHVGIAISLEHQRLDELLEGLKQAYLRGDAVMQGINAEQAFGTAYGQLRNSRSTEDCPVALIRPNGEPRSLGYLSMLMGNKLQELLLDAFHKGLVPVMQAVAFGQDDDAVFAEFLLRSQPMAAANDYMENLGIAEVRAFRSAMGFSPVPGRFEIKKRFDSLLRSKYPFKDGEALALYEYAGTNSEVWNSVLEHHFLQSCMLVRKSDKPAEESDQPPAVLPGLNNPLLSNTFISSSVTAAKKDETGLPMGTVVDNIMAVFTELNGTGCPVQQLATACLWEPDTDAYPAIMATPTEALLERIADYNSEEHCLKFPNLLAVLLCQPIQKIKAWADVHDHEDKVVSLLYKLTDDTRYLEIVKSLVRRGELFGQDLGL
jgi:hypothetical protein